MINYCIIPARKNSKRIKNKNFKKFCGKPIIQWPIEQIQKSKKFDKLFIYTDDLKIKKKYLNNKKITVIERSIECASDFTPILSSIRNCIQKIKKNYKEPDNICYVLPTAVLLRSNYLIKSFNEFRKSKKNFCFSVTNYSYPVQRSFLIKNKKISFLMKKYKLKRSQDIEKVFHDAGLFYWGKTKAFLNKIEMYSKETLPYKISNHKTIDIDNYDDWKNAVIKFKYLNKL